VTLDRTVKLGRVVAGACAASMVVACGVRVQQEPQPIERRDVPYGLLEQRDSTRGDERASFVVYFERSGLLVAVPRVVSTPATPEAVVNQVLRGPTFDEAAAGLSSAIPSGTALQSITRDGNVVTVDLSPALGESTDLATAVDQLDVTLRELPGVDAVRVLIDGVEVGRPGGAFLPAPT
jgi:spore germination protein GerM